MRPDHLPHFCDILRKQLITTFLVLILLSVSACQTESFTIFIPGMDDTATIDTATYNYVMNTDSEIVDWHYDTADGIGGQDEACYHRMGDSGPIVWCDAPSLIAQQCDDFESKCCCRKSCEPALCESRSGETVPCSYFDLADPRGYCSLPEDELPVTYACSKDCTPRSECDDVAIDGSCLDSGALQNGYCLLYDMGAEIKTCCQKICKMDFCDSQHMCVPLYGGDGNIRHQGACEPIAQ